MKKQDAHVLLRWRFDLWKRTYGNVPTAHALCDSIAEIQAMDILPEWREPITEFRHLHSAVRFRYAMQVVNGD